ncbi:hypothetical protein V6N13_013215 [Hibiscus sabdariffa]|uniref:GDSL esterase/lipase n=1 Tax=Hibiscus sabdariffa TaxID=183260 RepID=A0ABR2SHQ4_9ROSI
MASCSSLKQHFFVIIFVFLIITGISSPVNGCFTSIFSFGDSLTDTGNLLEISVSESAEALGFSLLPPFYGSKNGRWKEFQKGVNFAVAGATALNSSFLAEQGIHSVSTNISLGVELNSFKKLLPSLCSPSSNCRELLRNSLIVMGEIGGNDYNHPFLQGENTEKILQLVPLVVDVITSSINELIELGAETFLVPGNFPNGCSPSLLTNFQGSSKDKYDSTGCLTWLNKFSQHHNRLLQNELEKLRNRHPNVNIIYVDYYSFTMRIYRSPEQFGFKETVKACCGMGGPYNYDPSKSCGYPPLERCCSDPSSYINWDGFHYTEAANRWIASVVVEELMSAIPGLKNLCPTSAINKLRIPYQHKSTF